MMDLLSNYEGLAHGIVMQAVFDYRQKLEKYKYVLEAGGIVKMVTKHGKRSNVYFITRESIEKEMQPLERFFRGEWCHLLSGLDGDALIKQLKREQGIF